MSIQYVMLHTVENSVFSISELSNVCRFKCYLGGTLTNMVAPTKRG